MKYLLSILIIAIFSAMTFFHVRAVYFPSESRLPEIPASELLEVIDSSEVSFQEMLIYQGKREIGKVSFNYKKNPANDFYKIVMICFFYDSNSNSKSISNQNLGINSTIKLDKNFRIPEINLTARHPNSKLDGSLIYAEENNQFKINISRNKRKLLSINSLENLKNSLRTLNKFLPPVILPLQNENNLNTSGFENLAEIISNNSEKITTRKGKLPFAHIWINTYFVELKLKNLGKVNFYFDENGNILKIGPVENYQLISANLAPIYFKKNDKN